MSGWQLSTTVPKSDVGSIEAAILTLCPQDDPPAIASFEIEGTPNWQIDAFFNHKPNAISVDNTLRPHTFRLRITPAVNWVQVSQTHHQQVHAGRFHIHGSHHKTPALGGHNILLDAGMAFGTGQHETTLGCLRAIDTLAKKRLRGPLLDLGCGTGILAIALAKAGIGKVFASDIDEVAIKVARANARRNHVNDRVVFTEGDGFANPTLRSNGPFLVIVANIMAGPLRKMAHTISAATGKGGHIILSGLLNRQAAGILRCYREYGLVLSRRFVIGDWTTLVLFKKP